MNNYASTLTCLFCYLVPITSSHIRRLSDRANLFDSMVYRRVSRTIKIYFYLLNRIFSANHLHHWVASALVIIFFMAPMVPMKISL
ncbi:uncharacterized protein BYT42DRAFT_581871 [Radiomyces spectabilis]|uniref:uncharacterized protein n=1 Tax=Radiomyces spectabilis TaxID=64574 RepID=UPI00221F7073|nr:uncharacterized protein BYT42DRAFT_581871 [Radiomyces spectabilis]KAI8370335.1 hypothetical protein BYT42DRAFT_581871 [Radiomyces spectabilis]